MKEKIKEILAETGIEDVESIVDNIAKSVALFTVPKDKYNNLSERVKNVETEKENIETKYNDLCKQNMSVEDLQKAREKELADREAKIIERENESVVERLLAKNGISEDTYGIEEYNSLIKSLRGSNEAETTQKANSFLTILSKQKETVEKETTTKLLQNTPKPKLGGEQDEPDTELTKYKKLLEEATEAHNMTEMAYYTRVVSELESKEE